MPTWGVDGFMKLDVLAFGAHPDDVELSVGGTLAKLASLGHRTGIADMTRGELGTRGTSRTRAREAQAAAEVLELKTRVNLGLRDAHLQDTLAARLKVVAQLREFRPGLVFTHHWDDPHPDHVATSRIVTAACYLSGLKKMTTGQQRYRPDRIVYFRQSSFLPPSFLVDISAFFEQKMRAIGCFASQLHDPGSDEPRTYLSVPEFLPALETLNRYYGSLIRTGYAEGFHTREALAVGDPAAFFARPRKAASP